MSDKTFAEVMGEAPFDWNVFLDRAERGKITEVEQRRANDLAANWTTCACGNQCAIIPRHPKDYRGRRGDPVDEQLNSLGLAFWREIESERFASARRTLEAIEERAAVLIAKELALLNARAGGTKP